MIHHVEQPAIAPANGGLFKHIRKFVEADDLLEILETFQEWKQACLALDNNSNAMPRRPYDVYTLLRTHSERASHHLTEFWQHIAQRFEDDRFQQHESHGGDVKAEQRILIVGAGPAGLKAAIEMCLLKCERVVIVEKRDTFSRVNVMRIHSGDMEELTKHYGARDWYRKICIQDRDVVAIRRLQIILVKMALCLGAEVYANCEFAGTESDVTSPYWNAKVVTHPNETFRFSHNVLIIASGEKSSLPLSFEFTRSAFRAGTATGITCNFTPTHSPVANVDTMEGGRVSYLNTKFFNQLKEKGLELENVASYRTDESHYIVMTPKRATLLEKGVLREDRADPEDLVKPDNVDKERLMSFARQVATEVGVPENSEFLQMKSRKNGESWPDVAVFDFTTKTTASDPSKFLVEDYEGGKKVLLVALVGDALHEPFWPMGTGWARASHSCKLLTHVVKELGLDATHWAEHIEDVASWHQEAYLKLKSESYAPMTNVMGSG
ncbi:[F-actin]-monooxygenase mical3 [Gaertneriomyces sp. JEL0708]|nr:[F-actin]-monooxygenase mical3 [Gaertneriomyces sp. JEL0708]